MDQSPKWHPAHRCLGLPGSTLTIVVISWWLLLGGAVVLAMPDSEVAAMPTPISRLIGQAAIVHAGDLPTQDFQLVRIVTVEGDTVQFEVLEGMYAGHRGWARQRDLGPVD